MGMSAISRDRRRIPKNREEGGNKKEETIRGVLLLDLRANALLAISLL